MKKISHIINKFPFFIRAQKQNIFIFSLIFSLIFSVSIAVNFTNTHEQTTATQIVGTTDWYISAK